MNVFSYEPDRDEPATLGLIVLQSDETLETEFRQVMPLSVRLLVSRVPSGAEVSAETLQAMEHHIAAAAGLLPRGRVFDAVGYGCTSGTAQIGPAKIARMVSEGAVATAVTEPVSALIAACGALRVSRLAFLSPYVESVSDHLRNVLVRAGIASPVFGTFAEPQEAKVARISERSVFDAAVQLVEGAEIDALFLSCTNLRTFGILHPLQQRLGIPVLSSNLVLAWHMLRLAGHGTGRGMPTALMPAAQPEAAVV
ncbi:MAG: Asp/Glu racemase [Rhodobacter sp.]|nr:Asp/Glu racemase [Rhodobacter sp.]